MVKKKFEVQYWSSEEMRDIGESDFDDKTFTKLSEAVERAKKLYYNSVASSEVVSTEDSGEVYFHISKDTNSNGEWYNPKTFEKLNKKEIVKMIGKYK